MHLKLGQLLKRLSITCVAPVDERHTDSGSDFPDVHRMHQYGRDLYTGFFDAAACDKLKPSGTIAFDAIV